MVQCRAMSESISQPVASVLDEIMRLRSELEHSQREAKVLRVERDLLKERIKAFERKVFAAKSEARHGEQRDLFFNEAETLAVEPPATPIDVPAHRRHKGGRKPIDPDLPREIVRYELPIEQCICPHDGAPLKEIGIEASEQLDIVPAQVRVIRHERVKYACPCCDQGLCTAAGPTKFIPKSLLTENALAWIITAKYQDSLPLYRQAAVMGPLGGYFSRNTLAYNVVRAGAAVQPLINLLRDHWCDADLIHGDETPLQVLKEPGRAAQQKSYLWVRMTGSGPPIRLFTYVPSRSAKTALSLYDGARGALMTDGYEPYESVARTYALVHLGCLAHARRGFVEAETVIPKAVRPADHLATQFIALIGALYAIEARWREQWAAMIDWRDAEKTANAYAARHRLRQHESVAIVARIESLLLANLHSVVPNSLLGKALHYLHGQWPKLIRFLDDGRYPIDNNDCENAIRPFVVGRKNWIFSDTVAGAQASANLYSLIQTARANNIEPYRYLRTLFTALPHAKTVDDYEVLLPWNIQLIDCALINSSLAPFHFLNTRRVIGSHTEIF
jgi:transposase